MVYKLVLVVVKCNYVLNVGERMSKVKYFFNKFFSKFKLGCIVILFIFFGIPFIFGLVGSFFESLDEEENISLADGFTINFGC